MPERPGAQAVRPGSGDRWRRHRQHRARRSPLAKSRDSAAPEANQRARLPAPTTNRSSGKSATLSSAGPAWPRDTTCSTVMPTGSPPRAASIARLSRSSAARLQKGRNSGPGARVSARRKPCLDSQQRRVRAAGMLSCDPQGRQAHRRTAYADNYSTHAGHDRAPSPHFSCRHSANVRKCPSQP
jgi:hypothetical protein